jgi:hypothetical protein
MIAGFLSKYAKLKNRHSPERLCLFLFQMDSVMNSDGHLYNVFSYSHLASYLHHCSGGKQRGFTQAILQLNSERKAFIPILQALWT